MSHVRVFSRQMVNAFDPDPDQILIEDIAHHIARINRFTGASCRAVSVAEHSLLVSSLVTIEHRAQALLHDSAEYLLGDVSSPIKDTSIFEAYRRIEDRVLAKIYRKFGLPETMHPQVKEADRLACGIEAFFLMGVKRGQGWESVDAAVNKFGLTVWDDEEYYLPGYTAEVAEDQWLTAVKRCLPAARKAA